VGTAGGYDTAILPFIGYSFTRLGAGEEVPTADELWSATEEAKALQARCSELAEERESLLEQVERLESQVVTARGANLGLQAGLAVAIKDCIVRFVLLFPVYPPSPRPPYFLRNPQPATRHRHRPTPIDIFRSRHPPSLSTTYADVPHITILVSPGLVDGRRHVLPAGGLSQPCQPCRPSHAYTLAHTSLPTLIPRARVALCSTLQPRIAMSLRIVIYSLPPLPVSPIDTLR